MRILITSTGSWGTGSFTVINAITPEFLAMGHTVKVFFPDVGVISKDMDNYYKHPELYEIWKFPIEKEGISIRTFPLMIPDPHPRNPTNLTFKDLSPHQLQIYCDVFEQKIKKVIAEFKPDIIECQHIWIMAHIIQKLGLPYIVTAHHSDQMGFHFDARMCAMAKNAAAHAKYIFAISESVQNEVLELYKVKPNKIIVMPNGYDKAVFNRKDVDREKFLQELEVDIPANADIVNFAGKLSYTKGVDIILAANRILNNPKIHFLMFGTGNIEDVIKDKYPLKQLHFVGHQPPEILAQAHNISKLSIMPSRTEGFGIAGLEAMGCGLPIIVTQNTEPANFAIGEIIEQENPKQLAEAILKILNMPKNQYDNLSIKAEMAAQRFSCETIAKTRLRYYQ